jgi:hypothetical protein
MDCREDMSGGLFTDVRVRFVRGTQLGTGHGVK